MGESDGRADRSLKFDDAWSPKWKKESSLMSESHRLIVYKPFQSTR